MPRDMNGWRRDHLLEAQVQEGNPALVGCEVYSREDLAAIVARENIQEGERPRWHISISGDGRVPTWEELRDATHALRPGVMFCVPMPPENMWMNLHPHTLHVWEVIDPPLAREWAASAAAFQRLVERARAERKRENAAGTGRPTTTRGTVGL